jgi:hypothetical protein
MEIVATSSADRAPPAKSKQRSKIANGSTVLSGVDGRSLWLRRLKELIAEHVGDLGGDDNVSAAERALLRRGCVLIVECERLERQFALAGEASADQLETYGRVCGNLRRLLESVGLKRRSRPINEVTLGDILRDDLDQQRREASP